MRVMNSKYGIGWLVAAGILMSAVQAHAVESIWHGWDVQAEGVAGKSAALVRVASPCKVQRMQVVMAAMDAKGQVAFEARVEWGGESKAAAPIIPSSATQGQKTVSVMGVSVDGVVLAKTKDIVSAKAQPVWALCEGGVQVGKPASWALNAEQWKMAMGRLMPQMGNEVKAAASSGKPEPMPAVANVWSAPGMNPYDPKDMTVIYAWRNASAKPLAFDSATVKFFKTPEKGSKESPKTFMSVGFKGDRLMAPQSKGVEDIGTASVRISIPGLSTEQTMALGKSFEAHGVGMDKQYGEPESKK